VITATLQGGYLFCHQTHYVHISTSCTNLNSRGHNATDQRWLRKARFSINYLNDDKANESNKQEHPQSLNQQTYKNIRAENYSNNGHAVEAGVAVM
jgi:hypothetical protein